MGGGGSFRATEESTATGVQKEKQRGSRTEARRRAALTNPRGLSAHPLGRAGAGSWGSGFGGQTPGRGLGLAAWTQPEGASAPQLAGREAGKKSGAAEDARDNCFGVHEERGFRAPPKWAPETGVSCGYQHGLQRQAWDAKVAAATTKNPVCKYRSLSTPPLPGACAARHCQGPMIQGQLPGENTWRASGWCNVTPASAAAGSPCIPYPSVPLAWVSQNPLISCYFNPFLSEWRTDTLRWPTCRGGANPKLNPRSCANKEEKGKFLPTALGAAD